MNGFATTRWSLIQDARGNDRSARNALESLCLAYRPVVLAYFRRHGEAHLSEDHTQAFFLHFLEHRLVEKADQARGSFRGFLFTALENHRRQHLRSSHAIKRYVELVNDSEMLERSADPVANPGHLFDHDWALLVLSHARNRLRREAELAGKIELFNALQGFLGEAPEADEYRRIAECFAMPVNTIAVAVKRLRQGFAAQVRRELADTLVEGANIEAELEWLKQALRSS